MLTTSLTWNRPRTKPHKLTLTKAQKATLLLYLRHNQTEETLAENFKVSQPTISRIITTVETAPLHVLTPAVPSIPQALLNVYGTVIVDGTIVPTYN
jgi:transposase